MSEYIFKIDKVLFNDETNEAVIKPEVVCELIRCKDCKFWQNNNDGYPHEDCRWGHEETPLADDFCSCAERGTNETNSNLD